MWRVNLMWGTYSASEVLITLYPELVSLIVLGRTRVQPTRSGRPVCSSNNQHLQSWRPGFSRPDSSSQEAVFPALAVLGRQRYTAILDLALLEGLISGPGPVVPFNTSFAMILRPQNDLFA